MMSIVHALARPVGCAVLAAGLLTASDLGRRAVQRPVETADGEPTPPAVSPFAVVDPSSDQAPTLPIVSVSALQGPLATPFAIMDPAVDFYGPEAEELVPEPDAPAIGQAGHPARAGLARGPIRPAKNDRSGDTGRPGNRVRRVCRITAYCDRGTTASGVQSGVGQCAAPGDIPLGSTVYIPALGKTLVVTDRTHRRFRHNTVDIFMSAEDACREFGRRYLGCEFVIAKDRSELTRVARR